MNIFYNINICRRDFELSGEILTRIHKKEWKIISFENHFHLWTDQFVIQI